MSDAAKIIERMSQARIVNDFLISMLAHPEQPIRDAALLLLKAAMKRGAEEAKRDFEAYERKVDLGRLGDLGNVEPAGAA